MPRVDVATAELVGARAGPDIETLTFPDNSVPQLPEGSDTWTALETQLFESSGGRYHPGQMAQKRRAWCSLPGVACGTGSRLERVGRVSMVTPTMSSRKQYHECLWACFEAQRLEDKELVVVETYETSPSAFLVEKAKRDSRLVHVAIKVDPGHDFSVGLKRNMTLHLASGEYIVNFDDDDLYAPEYAEVMVQEIVDRGLHGVTLSSWYNLYVGTGACTQSDPRSWHDWASSSEELDEILYGYGFSYVHRRQVALDYPYPDIEFAEDAPFFLGLRRVLGKDKIALKKDSRGICMHIMHRANSAQVLSMRKISPSRAKTLAVAALEPFQLYLQAAKQSSERCDDPLAEWVNGLLSLFKALSWENLPSPIASCE